MSVQIIYGCSGCEATTSTWWSAKVDTTHIGGGIDRAAISYPTVKQIAPTGWVAADPHTHACYCPECWESIEAGGGTDG